MDSLYERIINQSNEKGLTGKDLAAQLGLKKTPLTDWKNGKSKPTLDQLMKMCEIFSISADYLLFGNPSEYEIRNRDHLTMDENKLLSLFCQMSDSDQKELLLFAEFRIQVSNQIPMTV